MRHPLLKTALVALLLLPCSTGSAANPVELYRISRDAPIIEALEILDHSPEKAIIPWMVSHDVRVLFKDMRLELGKAYMNHDALTIISNDDQQVIYINSKHMMAPPQALAALIRHEAMHDDRDNSLQEELTAWNKEGQTWQEMLTHYPELKQIPPHTVALVDRLNAINILQQQNRLQDQVFKNIAYQGLPEHSPGF